MDLKNLKLGIVVVSFNKKIDIIKCLASCKCKSVTISYYIIDNSTDTNIAQEIEKFANLYGAFYYKTQENIGFAKAVNIGIKKALQDKCDYILLLNDDAFLEDNCISSLIQALENNKGALLAGPTIFYSAKPDVVWSSGGYFNKFLSKINLIYKNKKLKISDLKTAKVHTVDFLSGCVLLIKKEAIEKIGYFDEDLFMYAEDLDYCLRVKQKGYKVLYVPFAFAWHDIDIINSRTNFFVMYHLARSNIIVRKKRFKIWYFFYYLLLHFLLYTPFRIYQTLKGDKIINGTKGWFKGTFDGIKFCLKTKDK